MACPHCGQDHHQPLEGLDARARCANCHRDLCFPDEPVELRSEGALVALLRRSALPVLVGFLAPTCDSSGLIEREMAKVALEETGRWLVARVDTDSLPAAAHHFAATSIPLLVVFRQGQEIARNAGLLPAAAIRHFLGQVL